MTCGALMAAAAAGAQPSNCSAASGPRINVIVEDVRSDRGDVVVELYPDDPKRFLAHLGRLMRVRQKAQRTQTNACIAAPTAGLYALVLYHDENNDEIFNRSVIGLPSEGFGLSNNPPLRLTAPSLASVRFRVEPGENTVRVRMRYIGGRRS